MKSSSPVSASPTPERPRASAEAPRAEAGTPLADAGWRGAVTVGAGAVLLAGPTVLAFFAGGYFDAPRAWAGLIAWVLVAVAVFAGEQPLPRARAARLAVGGLALLAAWSLLSATWAPIAGSAMDAGQRLAVYLGVLAAATALLRARPLERAVEPALAAGTLIVVGYGISERLLPGLLHFQHSVSAEGRLEQPLTYWNAMGEVAAIGVVLAIRVAGDATRRASLRAAAVAAVVPLSVGMYISFSRGALFACAAGLVTLVVIAPTSAQVRALLVAIVAGGLAVLSAAPFGGVTGLAGSASTREGQGAVTLVALLAICCVAAAVQMRLSRTESQRTVRLPRHAGWLALGVICAGLALAVVAGAHESSTRPLGGGANRLVTLQSNRYDYWRVALRTFADEPVRGVGAGGWAVSWLRLRHVDVGAQDAHSLPLQTAAELGVVGLALLVLCFGAIAVAARDAQRSVPARAAGPIAGLVVYAAHSVLDWDWEMPAVTLIALVLGGLLLALSDPPESTAATSEAPARRAVLSRAGPAMIAAGAVVIVLWFALGARAAHDVDSVRSFLASHPTLTPSEFRTTTATLNQAAVLNPDLTVNSLQAIVDTRSGRLRQGIATAQDVVRREPQSVQGWLSLQFLVRGIDPKLYALTQARIRALAPPVPASG